MRSILFKAKKLSDGKWVKGSLVKTPFGTFIEWYEDSICNKREVDTDTVCQFTGLKDCEGNEVWEHDLLTKDGSVIYEVGYEGCGFKASIKGEDEFDLNLVAVCKYDCICGNKFDRKEGEKDDEENIEPHRQ